MPGELARDSGSMLSLLRGSHLGSNCTGDNGSCRRSALPDDNHDIDATDDALRSGRPVWHASGELARDSGSMPLGTSLPRWSHCGSNCTEDDEGSCIGDCHQGSWSSQQMLFTLRPRIPPFISKPKEIGGCIDCGPNSAAGPNSSGDNDGTAPCSLHNHSIGNDSMTYVEWDPKCKCAIPSLLPSFCNLWTMFNNYILLCL